jgi:hypothetical protein
MRRATAVLSTAAMVVWAVSVMAQGKPDFTGKWAPDADKNAAAAPAGGGGGGGRGGPSGFELKQDATSLTRTTQSQNGPQTTTYKLDGSEQTVTMGQGSAKVTAKWDGSTIVITTVRDNNGTPVTTTAVYSMDGGDLVIATTAPPRGGGDPTTRKVYYKKGM